jgi:hypothetical protein
LHLWKRLRRMMHARYSTWHLTRISCPVPKKSRWWCSQVLRGSTPRSFERGGNKKGGSVIATNTNAQARREGEAGAQEELDRGAARSSDSENIERARAGPRDGENVVLSNEITSMNLQCATAGARTTEGEEGTARDDSELKVSSLRLEGEGAGAWRPESKTEGRRTGREGSGQGGV